MYERRTRGATGYSRRLFDNADVARRFQRRLREVGPPAGYARPQVVYDESGYPVEERSSLTDRVRRLITG